MSRHLFGLIVPLSLALSVSAQDDLVTAYVRFDNTEQKAVRLPVPKFPDSAKQVGIGGSLSVSIKLDENGNVATAEFLSGPGAICKAVDDPNVVELRSLAVEAAKLAKFEPIENSGDLALSAQINYYFPRQNNAPNKPVIFGVLNHQSDTVSELAGTAVSLPKPAYPPTAQAVRASGPVQVSVVIDEKGNVFSAEVISGHPLLRPASITAACGAGFTPAFVGGKPAWISGVITYNFTL